MPHPHILACIMETSIIINCLFFSIKTNNFSLNFTKKKRNHRDEHSNSKVKKTPISHGNRSGSSIEIHGVPLEYRLVMKDLEILKEAFDVN